jgi:hypothetical protein
MVNIADQVRLGKVQLVITLVDKDTLTVQQGNHCAVTQDGSLLKPG